MRNSGPTAKLADLVNSTPPIPPHLVEFLFYAKRKQIGGSRLLRFHFLDQLGPLATDRPAIRPSVAAGL